MYKRLEEEEDHAVDMLVIFDSFVDTNVLFDLTLVEGVFSL